MAELMCSRCVREVAAEDVVESDGAGVAHVNCRRPRDLTHEERSLLYGYCWTHSIVCPACGWTLRLFELDADPLDHYKRTRCRHCQAVLLETVREHVFACPFPPEGVRQRARETRETARRLVKQAHELRDRADVLMREAEVAAAALRESARQSVAEAVRQMIWAKLRSRALPREATPASLSTDDGAACAGCEQPLAPSQPVVVLAATVGGARAVIPLHAACFYIWDDERSRISGGDVITE
jgi:hypothetical protein